MLLMLTIFLLLEIWYSSKIAWFILWTEKEVEKMSTIERGKDTHSTAQRSRENSNKLFLWFCLFFEVFWQYSLRLIYTFLLCRYLIPSDFYSFSVFIVLFVACMPLSLLVSIGFSIHYIRAHICCENISRWILNMNHDMLI